MMKSNRELNLRVSGSSMEPTLFAGDIIHIVSGEYEIGDILVFKYKYDELLVHRYVGMKNNRFICKGDNAFRLEDVDEGAIIGKVDVIKCDGKTFLLPKFPISLVEKSEEIGKLFRKNKYNSAATKSESIYKEFCTAIKEYAMFRTRIDDEFKDIDIEVSY